MHAEMGSGGVVFGNRATSAGATAVLRTRSEMQDTHQLRIRNLHSV